MVVKVVVMVVLAVVRDFKVIKEKNMFKINEKISELINKYLGDFQLTPALATQAGMNISEAAFACNACDGGCSGGCWGCEGGCAGGATRR